MGFPMKCIRAFVAMACCADLGVAQWSVVELQEVQPAGYGEQGYGTGIAISGRTALVTAAVVQTTFVYEIDGVTGAWTETAEIPEAGYAVAVAGDTAVIGSKPSYLDGMGGIPGHASVFDRDGATGGWTMVAILEDPERPPSFWGEDIFGSAVAIFGDTIVVGAPGNAAAYVFERDQGGPNAWGLVAKLFFGDEENLFGNSVALDGNVVLVGAPYDQGVGSTCVFERQGANGPWAHVATLVASDAAPGDWFGNSVGLFGTTALVGAYGNDHSGGNDAGAAYVFERAGSAWQEVAKLTASGAVGGERFGEVVALDSDTAVVAAPPSLAAHVFKRNHGGVDAWGEIAALPAGFDQDTAVAVANGQVAVLDEIPDTGIGVVRGLAFDPATGLLYGSLFDDGQLVTVDPVSGLATLIGSIGFEEIEGLAFDPVGGVLYGSDQVGDQLVRIDPATGAGTAIGPFGFPAVRGLEFEAATGTLYGTDTNQDKLLRIDVQTGDATAIGDLGFGAVDGLALDPAMGALYGTDNQTRQLIAIDTQTGIGSAIGPWGAPGAPTIGGLAVDPASGQLWGVDGADRLIELDSQTGLGTLKETLWSNVRWVSVNAVSHASETLLHGGDVGERLHGADRGQRPGERQRAERLRALGLGRRGREGRALLLRLAREASQSLGQRDELPVRDAAGEAHRTARRNGDGRGLRRPFARDLNAFWCAGCPAPAIEPRRGRDGAGAALVPRPGQHEQPADEPLGCGRVLRDSLHSVERPAPVAVPAGAT